MPYEPRETGDLPTALSIEPLVGTRLSDLIRREGALNPEWVLAVVDSLADVLHQRHGDGITFGNVTTDSVMIQEDDGSARLIDPATETDSTPEGDVSALVAVMYEALCGTPAEVPPRSPLEHEPELDPALEDFFSKEFSSAGELRDAVRELRGIPTVEITHVEIPPPAEMPVTTRPPTPTPTHRTGWLVPLIVVVGLLAVLLFSILFLRGRDASPTAAKTVPKAVNSKQALPPVVHTPDPIPVEVAEPIAATPVEEPAPVAVKPAVIVAAPKPKPPVVREQPPQVKLVETAPVEAAPPVVETIESAPLVAAAPMTTTIEVVVLNSVRDGSLTLSANGVEIYSTELSVVERKWRQIAKSAVGKGRSELSATVQLPIGTSSIVARLVDSKGRDYEKSVEVNLEQGQTASLRVVTGRTLGKRLKVQFKSP